MSNHLLLREGDESISITMKRIGVSFALYYNYKYIITGHLFQDRFKSENIESTHYLLTVTKYIHQNSVKAGVVAFPEEWSWSICLDYYGKPTPFRDLLKPHIILNLFFSDIKLARELFKVINEL